MFGKAWRNAHDFWMEVPKSIVKRKFKKIPAYKQYVLQIPCKCENFRVFWPPLTWSITIPQQTTADMLQVYRPNVPGLVFEMTQNICVKEQIPKKQKKNQIEYMNKFRFLCLS